jgi:hypothetical protein
MAKGKLEFDLSDPFEQREFKMAASATEVYLALNQIANVFRQMRKYDREAITEEEFYSILEDYNIKLDTLL